MILILTKGTKFDYFNILFYHYKIVFKTKIITFYFFLTQISVILINLRNILYKMESTSQQI